MRRKLLICVEGKIRDCAKKEARIERKLFSVYGAEAYEAGVRLKVLARSFQLTADDLLLYFDGCIDKTIVSKFINRQ